jgi:hypothetical protein
MENTQETPIGEYGGFIPINYSSDRVAPFTSDDRTHGELVQPDLIQRLINQNPYAYALTYGVAERVLSLGFTIEPIEEDAINSSLMDLYNSIVGEMNLDLEKAMKTAFAFMIAFPRGAYVLILTNKNTFEIPLAANEQITGFEAYNELDVGNIGVDSDPTSQTFGMATAYTIQRKGMYTTNSIVGCHPTRILHFMGNREGGGYNTSLIQILKNVLLQMDLASEHFAKYIVRHTNPLTFFQTLTKNTLALKAYCDQVETAIEAGEHYMFAFDAPPKTTDQGADIVTLPPPQMGGLEPVMNFFFSQLNSAVGIDIRELTSAKPNLEITQWIVNKAKIVEPLIMQMVRVLFMHNTVPAITPQFKIRFNIENLLDEERQAIMEERKAREANLKAGFLQIDEIRDDYFGKGPLPDGRGELTMIELQKQSLAPVGHVPQGTQYKEGDKNGSESNRAEKAKKEGKEKKEE